MLDWFADRWNDLVDFLYRLVLTVYQILKDFVIWIFEQFMDLAILILNGMGSLFDGLDVTSYFSALPAGTLNILSLIGLSQAMGMILVAITIRIFLQLIPFVRLGS